MRSADIYSWFPCLSCSVATHFESCSEISYFLGPNGGLCDRYCKHTQQTSSDRQPRLNYLKITYIGVPLAVLGGIEAHLSTHADAKYSSNTVLPLLWNASSALRTLWRLKRSIPLATQKLFRFRVDPVSGRVKCAFNGASLTHEALLFSRTQAPQELEQVHGAGLVTDWMALFTLGIPINTARRPYPMQFVVDSTLETELTPLETDWKTFVYLALSMGCSPYDNQFGRVRRVNGSQYSVNKIQLVSSCGGKIDVSFPEGPPLVRLTGPRFRFSLLTALAWEKIMVIQDPNHSNLIHYLPLDDAVGVQDVPYSAQGLTGVVAENRDMIEALLSATERRTTPADKILESSLIWTLYTELIAHQTHIANQEILHTPQEFLQTCLNTFTKLRALSDGALSTLLNTILPSHQNLHVQITDSINTSTIDPNLDLWPFLQNNAHLTALFNSYDPLPTSRTPTTPPIDLTDISTPGSFLAALLLAFSTASRTRQIYNWDDQANKWNLAKKWDEMMLETGEIGFSTQPHPLQEILGNEDGVDPPRIMYFA